MNQARKSAVLQLSYDSMDFSLVQSLCTLTVDQGNATINKPGKWVDFKRVLMKVSFFKKHFTPLLVLKM